MNNKPIVYSYNKIGITEICQDGFKINLLHSPTLFICTVRNIFISYFK